MKPSDFPGVIRVADPKGTTKKWSPLTKLAICYHQDFVYLGEDVYEIAQSFINGLSKGERASLKTGILEFTSKNKNSKELLKDWYKKGAGAWDLKIDIRIFFKDVLEILG